MKFHKNMLLLYAITDRAFIGEKTLLEQIEEALSSGVTLLQLREKNLNKKEFLEEALAIRELTRYYSVPLIINDDLDVALWCKADGIHVGQEDMPAIKVRQILGPDRILGVTAKTPEQAICAWKAGADYLGAGAVFTSPTKKNASPLTKEELFTICHSVPIPVTAIGGITSENVSLLEGTGIAGISVISGIFGQKNIGESVHVLKEKMKKVVPS